MPVNRQGPRSPRPLHRPLITGNPDRVASPRGRTEAVFDEEYVPKHDNRRRYEFIVLDPPTPMGRKRTAFRGKDGATHYPETKDIRSVYHIRKAFVDAYPEMNPEVWQAKIEEGAAQILAGAALSLGDVGVGPIAGAVKLTVRLWHKCPTVMSKKRRIAAWMNPASMTTKPDLNNVINQVCDALTGYAYVDDKLVAELEAVRYYAVNRDGNDTSPLMMIIVEEL